MLFSDECNFLFPGIVNKQNYWIWSSECPQQVYQTARNSPSVFVWCALSQNELNGTCFFKKQNMTRESFKNMFCYIAFSGFQEYPGHMIFQKNDASSSLFCYRASIFRLIAVRSVGGESPSHFEASSRFTFISVPLLLFRVSEIYC